jgi:peroxidase
LKVSQLAGADGDMPPRNTFGFAMNNAAQKVGNAELYFVGDVRGDENPGVLMYHIIFLREHNRMARRFAALDKTLTDEQLFQLARKWVRAEFQAIS